MPKTHKKITEKIDELFTDIAPDRQEEIKSLLVNMHANLCDSGKSFHHSFVAFIVLWAVFYLIGNGLIQEAELFSLKVGKITTLTIAGPPILGGLFYSMLSSLAATEYLMSAISRVYKHVLPKVYSLDMEYLLAPPTFFNVERFLNGEATSKWLNSFTEGWIVGLAIVPLLGTIAALVHVSYLLWVNAPFSKYLMIASIFTGAVLWIRGLFVWITCVQASR